MRKIPRAALSLAFACAFFAMGASTADAQLQLGLRGAGFTLGFVDPEGADAALALGVFVDAGRVGSHIALEPYMDFWTKSEDFFGGGEVSARDITLGAKGKWMFSALDKGLQPYAGLGLGMHFTHASVTTPDFGFPGSAETYDDSNVKLGVDFGGGITAPVRNVELRGEMWYTLVSDWSQLSARFGVMWPFGG